MRDKGAGATVLLVIIMILAILVSGCSEDLAEEITQEINREVSEQYQKNKEELIESAENEYEEIIKGIKEYFSGMVEDLKDWFRNRIRWPGIPEPEIGNPTPELEPEIAPEVEHPLLSEEEFLGWEVMENMQSYREPDNLFPGKGYNCTWYVYGRMLQLGHNKEALDTMRANAYQWPLNASKGAFVVESTVDITTIPVIAYWNPGVGGANVDNGHVAVVERIHVDGSITVSESAWGKAYNIRKVSPGSDQWPSGFIVVP